MNIVEIEVTECSGRCDGNKIGYAAVLRDDYDTIRVRFLEAPDLLDRPPHKIIQILSGLNGRAWDMLNSACGFRPRIYLNNADISAEACRKRRSQSF